MSIRRSKRQTGTRVFISHSGLPEDMALASKIGNLLTDRLDARVFSTEELSAGENWEGKLRNQLAEADVIVAILSPNAVKSTWVLHEIGAAWGMGKPIIPVVTNRNVLRKIPLSLEAMPALEFKDLNTPERADEFVSEFQNTLLVAQIA